MVYHAINVIANVSPYKLGCDLCNGIVKTTRFSLLKRCSYSSRLATNDMNIAVKVSALKSGFDRGCTLGDLGWHSIAREVQG